MENEQIPPQFPAEFRKKFESKNIKIWLPIIVILLAVGYIYLANIESWWPLNNRTIGPGKTPFPIYSSSPTATPDPTADWKIYINNQYGFSLLLPQSWKGYTIIANGLIPDGFSGGEFGWQVIIRHPGWTKANPREDIPIQVFAIGQWKKWEADNFQSYPTAAPIGPVERGRNGKYVFATAPRYNYDFLTGYEEVEEIIKTLKAF